MVAKLVSTTSASSTGAGPPAATASTKALSAPVKPLSWRRRLPREATRPSSATTRVRKSSMVNTAPPA